MAIIQKKFLHGYNQDLETRVSAAKFEINRLIDLYKTNGSSNQLKADIRAGFKYLANLKAQRSRSYLCSLDNANGLSYE